MASELSSIVVISFLLLPLFVDATTTRKLMSAANAKEGDAYLQLTPFYKGRYYDQSDDDPSQYMYFAIDDLKMGSKVPLYFYKNDLYTLPPLIPKEEADLIPFSSRNLTFLLKYFSISKDSPQGKAMKETLGHCEAKTIENEVKFCATSLESLLDMVRETLGSSNLRVLTTKIVSKNPASYSLQGYTILKTPKELKGTRILGCHRMPYPYIVYYCHGHKGGSRIFEVSMVGDKYNDIITGPAICHMDTSTWDEDHLSFKVLGMKPRSGPVCHFFPVDNLVWVTLM